ncbi:uncharacterized protein LY79DRAFT_385144 [Colletotrichum navitas]|uniref:Uncharacterized protein n=1 Tax=Colletotrichum navitas TaxID=681940 RepID=A0AAD8Q7P9_9PEZI|nr:uncharacterized protein LY79DRAFT_385144 [Colletotrichum navitas]KAK1597420.1 hypothetical protein LY79DRAFT_385144 [Colletotrichum navitas]
MAHLQIPAGLHPCTAPVRLSSASSRPVPGVEWHRGNARDQVRHVPGNITPAWSGTNEKTSRYGTLRNSKHKAYFQPPDLSLIFRAPCVFSTSPLFFSLWRLRPRTVRGPQSRAFPQRRIQGENAARVADSQHTAIGTVLYLSLNRTSVCAICISLFVGGARPAYRNGVPSIPRSRWAVERVSLPPSRELVIFSGNAGGLARAGQCLRALCVVIRSVDCGLRLS